MKRSWIGFFLLMVLLTGAAVSAFAMVCIHEPIEEDLKQASRCALLGDWDNADRYFQKAQGQWKRWEHLRTCFADHNPVEQIDGDFEALEVYCRTREDVAFAADCRELARKVAAVGEAHQLVWWNVF